MKDEVKRFSGGWDYFIIYYFEYYFLFKFIYGLF